MGEFAPLAPLLGALGTFAFACIVSFALIQQMRHRDDRANNREDRMMSLVENHMAHNTEAMNKVVVAMEKVATTLELTRPR